MRKKSRIPGGVCSETGKTPEKEIFTEDGVAVLEWGFRPPEIPGDGKSDARIRRFYREIGARCASCVHTVLAGRARAAYRASDDPRKRFTFPRFRLSVTVEAQAEEADGTRAFLRVARLARGGHVLREERTVDRFTPKSGRLLPPKRVKKRGTGRENA